MPRDSSRYDRHGSHNVRVNVLMTRNHANEKSTSSLFPEAAGEHQSYFPRVKIRPFQRIAAVAREKNRKKEALFQADAMIEVMCL